MYGNGGLLTTVGDLLVWNENLVHPKVGNPKLIGEMTTVGKFNDGKPLAYGLGFFVEEHRGVHNVYHSGSTAGYRAHLNRFPDTQTSVAVLCNGSNGDASRSANRVSDIYLAGQLKLLPDTRAVQIDDAFASNHMVSPIGDFPGEYWSDEAETTLVAAIDKGFLTLRRRPDTVIKLEEVGPDTFQGSIGIVTFRRNARGVVEALSVKQDRVWDLRFAKK